jgi:NTE family protein
MRELRAIEFITRLVDDNKLDMATYKRIFVHSIRDDAEMNNLGVATKLSPEWPFLCRLRDAGRARADAWLTEHFDRIGRESSVDLRETFL